jgi:hypothetical protein
MPLLYKSFILSGSLLTICMMSGCYTNPQTCCPYNLFSDRDRNPTDNLIIGEASDRRASHNAREGTTRDR